MATMKVSSDYIKALRREFSAETRACDTSWEVDASQVLQATAARRRAQDPNLGRRLDRPGLCQFFTTINQTKVELFPFLLLVNPFRVSKIVELVFQKASRTNKVQKL